MKNPACRRNPRVLPVAIATALLLLATATAFARQWSAEYEKSVGDSAMAEVKKQYKMWDNPDQTKRVLEIVNNLKVVTQRPDVTYQIFLLDTKEENAFSIPGGYICVTKALIEAVESNDELAGVLAHEMAHNCTYDALNENHRQQELTLPMLAAAIATMVIGKNIPGIGNVLPGVMYVGQGIMAHYSIQVESLADEHGMGYMLKSGKYNPVGMLTFMERLGAEERSTPTVTLGIYQTHPLSADRISALTDQLQAAGVPINRRAVTKWDPPKVAPGKLGDQDVQVLSLWESELLSYNFAPAGTDTAGRGAALVKTLTDLLAAGVEGWEFSSAPVEGGGAVIQARGQDVIRIYPEDASLHGKSATELAAAVEKGLDAAFFSERLKRR